MDTYLSLSTDTLRYFDLASEATTSVDFVIVQAAVNKAHQRRCTENKWKFMLGSRKTLTVVPGQQNYVLPVSDYNKMHFVYSSDRTEFLQDTPTQAYANGDLSETMDQDSTNATRYEVLPDASFLDETFTGAIPAFEVLVYTSTDVGKGLVIMGKDEDGADLIETLTPTQTGTGPIVAAVSGETYYEITDIIKTDEFDGLVELNRAGNGDTLASYTAGVPMKKYPVLRFTTNPQQAEDLTYQYFKQPKLFQYDQQTPNIPFPHSGILMYDALLDLATYSELDSESVNIWRDKQQEYLGNLYFTYLIGDSVAGRTFRTSQAQD